MTANSQEEVQSSFKVPAALGKKIAKVTGLADVGVVFCSVVLNGSGKLLATPTLVTRGVVHEDFNQPLLHMAVREVETALKPLAQVGKDEELEQVMRRALKKFFRRELDAHPLILPKVLRLS